MKTKILLLFVFLSFSAITFKATAQYDVSSLAGPWFMQWEEGNPYDDNLLYIVFDGAGGITAISGFCDNVSGTYTVSEGGEISASLVCDEEVIPFTGQLTSTVYANMNMDGDIFDMNKVIDPGALAVYLTGSLNTGSCGSNDVQITVNSNGEVIASTGLVEPVSGRVYANDGLFIGHFYTGGVNGWNQFSIMGFYDSFSNHLTGQLGLDWSDCGTTTVNLIRSNSTEVDEPTAELLTIFPNPANDIINISCSESGKLNVYNLTGTLVRTFDIEKGEQQLKTEDLSNGIYILEMNNSAFSERQKIVVQK